MTRTIFTKPSIFLLPAIIFCLAAQIVSAGTFTVNTTADSGAGSLRQAIADANANAADADTIIFASPLFDTAQTINLTSADLAISTSMSINGTGARLLTVRRAIGNAATFRIFTVTNAGSVVRIGGMTISNGDASATGSGGGISNTLAALTLDGVVVSGNTSTLACGGIFAASGTATIVNSLVSGNSAINYAGGICVNIGTVNIANSTIANNTKANSTSFPGAGGIGTTNNTGSFNLNNVTISGNSTGDTVTNSAGGLYRSTSNSGSGNVRNTIISGNTAANNTSPDVFGTFISNGNNLIGNTAGSTSFTQPTDKTNVAALLGPLANNGGQTDTFALLTGSPAIDAGSGCVFNSSCAAGNPPVNLASDQRATFTRRYDNPVVTNTGGSDGTDIGAFELQLAPTAAQASIAGRVLTGGKGLANARVELVGTGGQPRTVVTNAFGYFAFDEVPAGMTYVVNVAAKRYTFAPQVVSVTDNISGLTFTAQ